MLNEPLPVGPDRRPIESYDYLAAPIVWLVDAGGLARLGKWDRELFDEKTGEPLSASVMDWGMDNGGLFQRFERFQPVSWEPADEAVIRDTIMDL